MWYNFYSNQKSVGRLLGEQWHFGSMLCMQMAFALFIKKCDAPQDIALTRIHYTPVPSDEPKPARVLPASAQFWLKGPERAVKAASNAPPSS